MKLINKKYFKYLIPIITTLFLFNIILLNVFAEDLSSKNEQSSVVVYERNINNVQNFCIFKVILNNKDNYIEVYVKDESGSRRDPSRLWIGIGYGIRANGLGGSCGAFDDDARDGFSNTGVLRLNYGCRDEFPKAIECYYNYDVFKLNMSKIPNEQEGKTNYYTLKEFIDDMKKSGGELAIRTFHDRLSSPWVYLMDIHNNVVPDPNLRSILNTKYLGQESGSAISKEQLKSLKGTLILQSNNIKNIEGLEYCTNVSDIYLNSNPIDNINPLANLKQLKFLNLGHCYNIKNISSLKNLTNLTSLFLDYNQIKDVSPLKDLTNLKNLTLNNNQISDISPLKGLNKLTSLTLGSQSITNISKVNSVNNIAIVYDIVKGLDENIISPSKSSTYSYDLKNHKIIFNNILQTGDQSYNFDTLVNIGEAKTNFSGAVTQNINYSKKDMIGPKGFIVIPSSIVMKKNNNSDDVEYTDKIFLSEDNTNADFKVETSPTFNLSFDDQTVPIQVYNNSGKKVGEDRHLMTLNNSNKQGNFSLKAPIKSFTKNGIYTGTMTFKVTVN